MQKLLYVTSNTDKFLKAQFHLKAHGIELVQEILDLDERQISDGSQIVQDKAVQAFARLQQRLLANDDSWSIPALNGFPGPNMKQCNHFLRADDWLRLMANQTDRRIFLDSHFAFHSESAVTDLSYRAEYYFLEAAQGTHQKAPHLEVIARKGNTISVAAEINQGLPKQAQNPIFWKKLARIILNS